MIRRATPLRPVKVLGFTDTHLDDYPGCRRTTMKLMRETIEAEKPDLVVFVGDNVTGGDNRARAHEFAELMTDLGVPWAPVLGNHEGDNPASVSRGEMIGIFRTSPLCLIPETVHDITDYSVPIYNAGGEMCFRLIFMDGGSDMSREDMVRFGWGDWEKPYDDYLKPGQIEWYRREIQGDQCPSMVFCHIPIPEFRDAMREGALISGGNLENVCSSPHNSGMFDAMTDMGKTVAFVAGHDHINSGHYMYRGVRLIYNRMSGLSSYNVVSKRLSDKLMQGCSVYYIHHDGRVTFDEIIYEDRYPQYHDEIYAVIRTPDKKQS